MDRRTLCRVVATLLINVTGSFLLGWLTSSAAKLWPHSAAAWVLFLGTGLCGAYTTFSTFSYEVVVLVREGRMSTAGLYIVSTFLLGFPAAAMGLYGLPH
jgi:CrcB protein